MSDTTDAEIDEIIWGGMNKERQVIALKALLLREREKELTKFHDVIWPFEPHEPCPYCMGESYSVEHSYYDDRLAKLSRLSGEGSESLNLEEL